MGFVSFEFSGKGAERRLSRLRKAFSDFRPVWTDYFKWYADYVKKRYDTGGDGQWKQLSNSTVTQRSRRTGYYRAGSSEGPTSRIGVWTRKTMNEISAERSNPQGGVTIVRKKHSFRHKVSSLRLSRFERKYAKPKRTVLREAIIVAQLKHLVRGHIMEALR